MNSQIKQAAEIICNGGIISYPTESVFGLGCDPLSEAAVNRILQLKQRTIDKGLIIIAGTLEQLSPYIRITHEEEQKILNEASPTTWLVKKSAFTPGWISGKHRKVAIRISHHPVIIDLCQLINHPLVSTSANLSGEAPAINSQQSQNYFLNKVDFYLEDSTRLTGKPTQIRDIETDAIIR